MLKVHETRLGAVELVPSSGGKFEVSLNGNLVFSKASLGRHPEEGEVLRLVEKALQKGP
jgi:selenoprotein W-related protein